MGRQHLQMMRAAQEPGVHMSINIGPTLRRLRERKDLTQQELADRLRMQAEPAGPRMARSASYISSIERGKTSPTLQELEELTRCLGRRSVLRLLDEAGKGG